MKKIQIVLCLALQTGVLPASAQWRPYAQVDAGLTTIGSSSGFLGMVAGGVRVRRWGVGLAGGVDNATIKSVPILVETRWMMLPGAHSLELFQQGGLNTVHKKFDGLNNYLPGYYLRGGAGWRLLQTSHAGGLWTSAGYRLKTYTVQPAGTPPEPWLYIYYRRPNAMHFQEWEGFITLNWRW